MIDAVIFDIDGTLIDSVDLHAEAWVEALRHFGVEVPVPTMRHEIGKGGDQLLPLFVPADRLDAEAERISAYRADLFRRDYLAKVRPFAEVSALFRKLKEAGHTIALASSGKADEVATYADIAGVADLVDVTTSADDARRSKPDPEIFRAALGKLAPIGPERCIVVGDTAWDVIAARGAGLRCIGMLCGGVAEAELREAGAITVYRDPAHLLASYRASPLA